MPSPSSPPGYNEDVVKHCIDIELPVLPGTVTPSEVTAAENLGLKVTKFFPASQYGGRTPSRPSPAPFVGHRFMPTGGVSTANVEEYLSSSAIIACVAPGCQAWPCLPTATSPRSSRSPARPWTSSRRSAARFSSLS